MADRELSSQKRVISDADRELTPKIGSEDENEKKKTNFPNTNF